MGRKITKKIIKITLIVLAVFISVDLLAVGLLFVPPIQQKVVNVVTEKLSEKWHSKVSVKHIYLSPTLKLTADDFTIYDHKGNPMISAGKLSTRLKSLQLSPVKVGLRTIDTDRIKVIIRKYSGDESVNISLWAQNFKKEKKKKSQFVLKSDAIVLKNAYFLYENDDKMLAERTTQMDYGYFELKDLNWKINQFVLNGADISGDFEYLAFTQYTGFKLLNLSCGFRINGTGLTMKDATLVTPTSRVFMDFAFKYNDWKEYGDFLNKINFDVTMKTSTFNLHEISYFAPQTAGMDDELVMSCRVKGPVNDLDIQQFDAHFADNTHLGGRMKMKNIPDFFNADIQADLVDNVVDFNELQKFKLPHGKTIALPKMLTNLGSATADITYDGCVKKGFTASAQLATTAGGLQAVLTTVMQENGQGVDYDAQVKTSGLKINKFFPAASMIGSANLAAVAKGSVGDMSNFAQTLKAKVSAKVGQVYVQGYPIRNIRLNGTYQKKQLVADLSVRDPNCELTVDGNMNLASAKHDYDFQATIDHISANKMFAHLAKVDSAKAKGFNKFVYYVQKHPELNLSVATIDCALTGKSLQDMAGSIFIDGIQYQQDNRKIQADRIRLAMIPQADRQVLRFTSDWLNANLTTNYKLSEIPAAVMDLAYAYCGKLLPARSAKMKDQSSPSDTLKHFLDFDATAFQIGSILDIFVPNIHIADNTHLAVSTDTDHESDRLVVKSDSISIGDGVRINDVNIIGKAIEANRMQLAADVENVAIGKNENFVFDDIHLQTDMDEKHIVYSLQWQNPALISSHQSLLNGDVSFPSTGIITTKITEAQVYLKEEPITFNKDHLVTIDHGKVLFDNVRAYALEREVAVNGYLGKSSDSLTAVIKNFDMDVANQFIKTDKMHVAGDMSANMQIRTYRGTRVVLGTLIVDGFEFNGASFGHLFANAVVPADRSIMFRGGLIDSTAFPKDATVFNYTFSDFQKQKGVNTRLNGRFDTDKKEMRVQADIDSLPLGFLEPILSSFSHKFTGDASGKLEFVMNSEDIYFDGVAHVREAQMGIAPLNTIYNIVDQDVFFTKDGFDFKNMVLTDQYDNHATLNGYIHHQKFQNFDLNLNINTPKIFVLNTKQSSDTPFYGTGFVSGTIAIYGNTEKLYFSGHDIATEKGTVFCLPISFADKVYDSDVITFMADNTVKILPTPKEEPPSSMEMDFDFTFDVTPAAEIRLNLDLSAFGGNIKTSGEGTLHFTYNTKSDISILGDVKLAGGSFMMSFVDLVNKKFELQPGGVVSFDGSLDNININARALYSTSASLADLFTAENTNIRRMPVKAYLNFNGNLSDPAAIDFAFDLPNATSDLKTLFYSTIDTTNLQSKTEQFFSLVMLGKFASAQSSIQNINIENTGIGVITNTLSNFISNQLKFVDVSLNYQNASADKAAEYSVGASTSLFNDRTTIEGYFGYKDDKTLGDMSSQFIGDFSVEQKLNELGTWRLKVFNVTNQDELRNATRSNPYAQGIAVIYKQDFNNRKDLIASFKRTSPRTKRKKKDKIPIEVEPIEE